MDIKKFKLWNKVTALAVLAISAFTYLSTIEPTASFLGLRRVHRVIVQA